MGNSAVAACAALILVFGVRSGVAQTRTAEDSAFTRAQQLVARGEGAAGRLLVDSVLTSMSPDSPRYAEGLYWRARLATVDHDKELDYRRIVVEYPMSPRSGDALLAIAGFEQARGDNDQAALHLRRFLIENPGRGETGRTALTLSQLLFDQHNPTEACATLLPAHDHTPDSAAELKNQMAFLLQRCRGVDTSARASLVPVVSPSTVADTARPASSVPPPPAPVAPVAPKKPVSTAKPTTPKPAAKPPANPPTKAPTKPAPTPTSATAKPKYTVQVGAFDTKSEADLTASHLTDQGMDARVVGTKKPYRVQVGQFVTRAEADSASTALKARKITNFVTTLSSGG